MKMMCRPPYDKPGSYQAAEVEWYRRHGAFRLRIRYSTTGAYVISDRDWNASGRPAEYVEERMKESLGEPKYFYPEPPEVE